MTEEYFRVPEHVVRRIRGKTVKEVRKEMRLNRRQATILLACLHVQDEMDRAVQSN